MLKAKELCQRPDKRKELHANAELGETVGEHRRYFEPEQRDSTLYLCLDRVESRTSLPGDFSFSNQIKKPRLQARCRIVVAYSHFRDLIIDLPERGFNP